ncbi:GntR family transcriptional regulator [Streptomyces actuosus]|uniref:GntR family transcriptional regulator n=1 Tax=Streptomyces actuosus TaxID=1885 RepID=A0ABS2VPU1_STRAS|nr:GntR family transcriptional regulator [Streptomyces actuosus]MBN0045101.1 GntR family transcriptional regulator [Streptomyces actuosus]
MYDAILGRIAEGRYPVGGVLPTRSELSGELNCSKDTLQRVMDKLAVEKYIRSRQGSKTVVLRRPSWASGGPQERPQLYSFLHELFVGREHVTLDVSALTGESFVGLFKAQVGRVQYGEFRPRTVRVRILLPDERAPLYYPRSLDPDDDSGLGGWRERVAEHVDVLRQCHTELSECGVESALEVRRLPMTPGFKLYVLNGSDVLLGYYLPVRKPVGPRGRTPVPGLDVMGVGAPLHHHPADPDEHSEFAALKHWFEAQWDMLGDPLASA